MAIVHVLAVLSIVLLAFVTVIIFVAVVAATILVTVGVRREERLKSLSRSAPGRTAQLARMLLAVPAPRLADEIFPRPEPVDKPAWYERTAGSSLR